MHLWKSPWINWVALPTEMSFRTLQLLPSVLKDGALFESTPSRGCCVPDGTVNWIPGCYRVKFNLVYSRKIWPLNVLLCILNIGQPAQKIHKKMLVKTLSRFLFLRRFKPSLKATRETFTSPGQPRPCVKPWCFSVPPPVMCTTHLNPILTLWEEMEGWLRAGLYRPTSAGPLMLFGAEWEQIPPAKSHNLEGLFFPPRSRSCFNSPGMPVGFEVHMRVFVGRWGSVFGTSSLFQLQHLLL